MYARTVYSRVLRVAINASIKYFFVAKLSIDFYDSAEKFTRHLHFQNGKSAQNARKQHYPQYICDCDFCIDACRKIFYANLLLK